MLLFAYLVDELSLLCANYQVLLFNLLLILVESQQDLLLIKASRRKKPEIEYLAGPCELEFHLVICAFQQFYFRLSLSFAEVEIGNRIQFCL